MSWFFLIFMAKRYLFILMMQLNCVILEDEPLARAVLVSLLQSQPNLTLLAAFSRAEEATDFFLTHPEVDLLFLDVELNGTSGIDFYRQLPYKPAVIFTTAYETFAFTAFELGAVDYLKKPIDPVRLQQACSKITKTTKPVAVKPADAADLLYFKQGRNNLAVERASILFFEASKDYIKIVTETKSYLVLLTMKALQQQLNEEEFIRINKSYILNKAKITKTENSEVYIQQYGFTISRMLKKDIQHKLGLLPLMR